MNIGQASDATGVSAKMIRYYEEIGLIRPPTRTQAGYRIYGENDLHMLRFVRRARDLGFAVAEIADLVALWQDRSRASGEVKRIAMDHIAALEAKAAALRAMSATLRDLAERCHGDTRPDCPILADLSGARSAQPSTGTTSTATSSV